MFGRDVDERGQKALGNVLFIAQFFLRKKEKVAKTTGHKIYSSSILSVDERTVQPKIRVAVTVFRLLFLRCCSLQASLMSPSQKASTFRSAVT